MKALVKYADEANKVEVRDVPKAEMNDNQVLLKVAAIGVCGSDIHMWRQHHSWPIKIPLILGHEFSGTVEAIGKNVAGFHIGNAVTCETACQVCGTCLYCRSGRYHLCPSRLGFGALNDGSMCEYIAVRPDILHHIPKNVSLEYASLTEPCCVAANAIFEMSSIKPGDTVAIQGAGAIGILCMQMAKLCGAGTLIILGTDIDENRLRIAKEIGAHYALNIQRDNPMDILKTIGDGYGADLVVDATGASAALIQSMEMVRPLGQITKVGWGPQPFNHSLDLLVKKSARLQATFSHTYVTWERVLTLMSTGQLILDPIIGGVYSLDKWQEAFEDMETGKNIKSVLRAY